VTLKKKTKYEGRLAIFPCGLTYVVTEYAMSKE